MNKKEKKSQFEITITDAFEVGKVEGAREILKELEDLSIVDPHFRAYIKARKKSFEEKIDLINKYKLVQG